MYLVFVILEALEWVCVVIGTPCTWSLELILIMSRVLQRKKQGFLHHLAFPLPVVGTRLCRSKCKPWVVPSHLDLSPAESVLLFSLPQVHPPVM